MFPTDLNHAVGQPSFFLEVEFDKQSTLTVGCEPHVIWADT